MMFGKGPLEEPKLSKLTEAVGYFDAMLKGHNWAAADYFTVADLTLIVTISQLEAFGFDFGPVQRVQNWMIRCKKKLEPFGYDVCYNINYPCMAQIGTTSFHCRKSINKAPTCWVQCCREIWQNIDQSNNLAQPQPQPVRQSIAKSFIEKM